MRRSTGQPGLADLRHERRHVREARLGRERVGAVAAQHPDHPSHLDERSAADLLDRLQHFVWRACALLEDASLGAGLHHHHRDVVRDRVVQLARDARALLDDRLSRRDVALALGEVRLSVAVFDDVAHDRHHDHDDRGERDAARDAAVRQQRRQEVGCDERSRADDELAIGGPHGQRVEGHELRDRVRGRSRVPERACERARDRHDDAREQRPPAPERDRDRHERGRQRGAEPMVGGVAAQQDRGLREQREGDRDQNVDRDGVGMWPVGRKSRAHETREGKRERRCGASASWLIRGPREYQPTG